MKKEFKIAICVILAIWIFIMGIEIGAFRENKDKGETTTTPPVVNITTTQPTTQPTTLPTTQPTTQPSVVDPSNGGSETTTQQAAPSDDPTALSKAQVVEKMNSAVNTLKAEANMTAYKKESIKVEVVSCSVQAAVSAINNIIQGIAGDEEFTYTVVNGQTTDEDGNTVSAKDIIPPTKKDFSVAEAGISEAKAYKEGENTVYYVKLINEDTTAENPVPLYNSAAIGYLDLTALDLPGVTISKADMHYVGGEVIVTCNPDGKVIKLVNKLPMTGEGVAKIAFFEGTATFEGGLNEEWTITY